jgi:hypothetical protein
MLHFNSYSKEQTLFYTLPLQITKLQMELLQWLFEQLTQTQHKVSQTMLFTSTSDLALERKKQEYSIQLKENQDTSQNRRKE